MPAILKNDQAEALLLDIRTARAAGRQAIDVASGAFVSFPTSVVVGGLGGRGQLVYPLRCNLEPGTVVTAEGAADVAGNIAGVAVEGSFSWSLGGADPPPAEYRFRRRRRDVAPPAWAALLPRSQRLAPEGPATLARQQNRLRRRGRDAESWLLRLTERHLRRSCTGFGLALAYRPPTDADDLVQRGLQAAARLLPVYAGPNRPPCSWLGMLRLDARRDLNRELTQLDWLPVDAVAALAVADACGVELNNDPADVLREVLEAATRLGRPAPRLLPAQLQAAIRAPALFTQASLADRTTPGPEDQEDEPGQVAATVAGLVSANPTTVTRAGTGDPVALARVGDQVVRRLQGRRPVGQEDRARLWERFQASGHLFATPEGRARFGADPETLATIDASLRRAAGVRAPWLEPAASA